MNFLSDKFSLTIKSYDKSLIFVTICISLYIATVFCLPLRTSWLTFTITTICLIFGLSFLYQRYKTFTLTNILKKNAHVSNSTISFRFFFLITTTVMGFYLYVSYPGYINPDTISQWIQVQEHKFCDWHPAIHTFFIATFSYIYNDISFAIACQMLIFSLVISSLYHELSKLQLSKALILITFFITILSPFTAKMITSLLKDAAFAIAVLGITEIFVLTYFSKGIWIQSIPKSICFGILLGITSLLRHNAILFTIPFLAGFTYWYCYIAKHKLFFIKIITIVALSTVLIIKGPVYKYFDVKPHAQPQAETVGIPMSILSELFMHNPSVLDQETNNFMLKIAAQSTWNKRYHNHFNSIKHSSKDILFTDIFVKSNSVIMEFGISKLLKKAYIASLRDMDTTLNAIINVTYIAWSPFYNVQPRSLISLISLLNMETTLPLSETAIQEQQVQQDWFCQMFNDYGRKVAFHGNSLIKGYLQMFVIFFANLFEICFAIGIYILLLLLSTFISFYRLRWHGFIIISPILIYNFGTALLLCGSDDIRLFFFITLITFPYMFILLSTNIITNKIL